MEPRVAVVVPCYQQARFLPEAVRSVVAQTERGWELVIVDDGSPDDTAIVAAELIAAHPEQTIRLLRQPNAGLGLARNAGIAATSARYILPLDADDALEPAMLERAADALDADPAAGFAYADALFFGEDVRHYRTGPFDRTRLAFNNTLMAHSLIRRDALLAVGGYAGRDTLDGFEDWDLWLGLVERGWHGHYLAEPLVRYRRRNASMLAIVRRDDLALRARIILRHQRLYPPGFVHWARRYLARSSSPSITHYLRGQLAYTALVGRHAPRHLPKTLLRPLYVLLPARRQGRIMRLLHRLRHAGSVTGR